MPVDPPFAVYRDQLSALSLGLALWNPKSPREVYNSLNNRYDSYGSAHRNVRISIGDVGYLQEGMFIRMFNVTLPWDHPLNEILGKPEPYDYLDCGPFTSTIEAHFDKVDYYSRSVTAETNLQAMTPDE